MNNPEELQGLSHKDFDQIYDETRARHPDISTEKVVALVNAKMQIRKLEMNTDLRRQQVESYKPSRELYEGWKAFELHTTPDESTTEEDFLELFARLQQRKPGLLLFLLPVWQLAHREGGESANAFYIQKKNDLVRKADAALKKEMEGKTGEQMLRFIKVMSRPDEQES